MKKFAYILAMFTIMTGTMSCSLDKLPVTDGNAEDISTVAYINGLRTGMYELARELFTGQQIYYPDYQSDLYNELTTSGNRGGFWFRWTLQSSDTDVQLIWENCYTTISRINLLISSVDRILDAQTAADQATINGYKGEALLLRAMIFRNLALRFCVDYEPATASTVFGVPLQTEYVYDILNFEPKGRGTLQDTYTQILADIEAAKPLLTRAGSVNSVFLNADCITAFEVQVYVDMHNYSGAISTAQPLIDKYALETTKAGLESMWRKDESSETIFQFGITLLDRNGRLQYTDLHGGTFNASLNNYLCNAVYIPGQWVVDLYDQTNDLRFNVYIASQNINFSTSRPLGYVMYKFLGSEKLRTLSTSPTWFTMTKTFRIADIILLKAEAEYRTGSANAESTLNLLREARGLDPLSGVTGIALFQEIKNERVRELIGEGGRMPDLKRWGDGFTRVPQTGAGLNFQSTPGAKDMTVAAGAPRFLLPIPISEFGVNQKIIGQQNPGFNE